MYIYLSILSTKSIQIHYSIEHEPHKKVFIFVLHVTNGQKKLLNNENTYIKTRIHINVWKVYTLCFRRTTAAAVKFIMDLKTEFF